MNKRIPLHSVSKTIARQKILLTVLPQTEGLCVAPLGFTTPLLPTKKTFTSLSFIIVFSFH